MSRELNSYKFSLTIINMSLEEAYTAVREATQIATEGIDRDEFALLTGFDDWSMSSVKNTLGLPSTSLPKWKLCLVLGHSGTPEFLIQDGHHVRELWGSRCFTDEGIALVTRRFREAFSESFWAVKTVRTPHYTLIQIESLY